MQYKSVQLAALAVALTVSVSACSRIKDSYEVNPVVIGPDGAQEVDGKVVFKAFNIETDTLPGGNCGYAVAAGSGSGSDVTAAADAAACRNRLMDHLIMLSDQRCAAHKAAIEANAAGSNFVFSTVTTLLGGAGAIVTGADAARALAGAAGATSGVHANWNESIYQKNVAAAIVGKIDDMRNSLRQKMMVTSSNKDVVYSVDAMLADVYRYHDACSFYSGIMNLARNDTAPTTADALRGRIDGLRSQIKANDDLANKSPAAATALTSTNNALLKSLNHLTIQLGVVESRSGSVPSAAEGSPTSETAKTK
ncbi:hypothetical protein [Magnetospirillum sulfuroxidans]|uniref:Lipoprotein n=1 Tax=Magnetospirillum sulfuroxidans TaxID=611300 RepID=A0ABS5ICS7_9PROT|nr:hypothetical protein [Magnetospirillum sulfuroxidans]MBR9972195.1 hypothetical protein [Magnetospirillum sulfuroxidans]